MYHVREATPSDLEFIHNSWLRSSWWRYKEVPNAKHLMSRRIEAILRFSQGLVCVDDKDPDIIYGYVIYDPTAVHWVYTKYSFRGMGIAKTLLDKVPEESRQYHTSDLKSGKKLAEKYDSQFQPFIYERMQS